MLPTQLFRLNWWLLWTSEHPLFNVFKNLWNFDFKNLFKQFTFTRNFQKSRFSTRFDPVFRLFGRDLVTKAHWSLVGNKISFLKNMFSRLTSVHVGQLRWLKQRTSSTSEHPIFNVCEKFTVFRFEVCRSPVLAKVFSDAHKSEIFRNCLSNNNWKIGRHPSQIFEMRTFS